MGSDRKGNYIVCEDLFKIYKVADLEVVALRGLDMKVPQGEIVAIVGPSGSGKSTLLNILAGYDTPSAGRVVVGGKSLLKLSQRELMEYRRTGIGFVWQQVHRNLVPYLSAQENVELPMLLTNLYGSERSQRAAELLDFVGMTDRSRYTLEKLSGGEQQRVSIATALANNPPLLLADEPTGELDTQTAAGVFKLFRSINSTHGTTIVIVTHDPGVARFVDRVVSITDGKTSTEVVRRTTFRRPGEGGLPLQEFSVLDSSGRLQIPKEYLEKLDMGERAKVTLEDDHVEVRPEDGD